MATWFCISTTLMRLFFVTVYALTMPDAMQGIAADAAFACQSAGVTLPIAMDSDTRQMLSLMRCWVLDVIGL